MRVPHTIPSHAFEAFRCSEETQQLPGELGRTLRAEDASWDDERRRGARQVAELKSIALRAIARDWRATARPGLEELPTTVDRDHLLELLPLDLPFELAVRAVPYQHYWQRAAEARWRFNDPAEHGGSWLRLYCERHLSEWLECLDPALAIHSPEPTTTTGPELGLKQEPEQRLSQECESLLELVREHVRTLRLRQLLPLRCQATSKTMSSLDNEDDEEQEQDSVLREPETHHAPMDLILEKLPHLRDVYVNIGMIFTGDGVESRDFEFSVEDCLKIGRGLKNLEHLRKFSLTRSDLDRPRAAAILQGLAVNNSIEEIDFSHCKLGNAGAHAIGAFVSQRCATGRLEVLRLTNNGIGARGLAGLVRGLLLPLDGKDESEGTRSAEELCTIRRLDLRLNPLGDEGAGHLAALLLRFSSLEYLNVSGCSLGADGGMGMAEVLAGGSGGGGVNFSGGLELDCSNNDFGTIVGEAFEIVAKSCLAITELDVRMCGFRKESEYSISESISRNRASMKKEHDRLRSSSSVGSGGSGYRQVQPNKRGQSLVAPREFAMFQRPRREVDFAVADEDDDDEQDDEEDEGSERSSKEEHQRSAAAGMPSEQIEQP